MNKHLLALEYDKLLEAVKPFAGSKEGKEAVLLLRPLNFLSDAQAQQEKTAAAFDILARFGAPSFGGIRNVNGSLARAQSGGVLTMGELLKIAGVLRAIRELCQWRESFLNTNSAIDPLLDMLCPNRYFEEKIFGAIISEDEMSDHASPQLYEIRRKKRAAASRIRDQLEKMVHSSFYQKLLRDPIVTIRNGRYVVPVKVEHRGEVKGLVHDTSSSGSTVFIEPAAVVEVNNSIKLLESQERDEIERILEELSLEAGSFYESIKLSCSAAVELDVIFAKAKYAFENNCTLPELNFSGEINLKRARHPLISKGNVVPVDIRLGQDFDALVITGPNTGGKTVAIKTIGLLTLMAMTGMMIPANEGSTVSVFEHVFADIGDEQSIEQSLSTFSSHIGNIKQIIENTNSSTLALIDELGAGTDPVEGAALATAIIESLLARGAKIAATTHYAELKAYALRTDRVQNGSCEFDVNTLRPTYRLLIGVPGRSNAFAISKHLGIESSIIDRANELVENNDRQFEETIKSLETIRLEYEKKAEEAEKISKKAKEEIESAEKIKSDAEKLKQRELQKAKDEAERIVLRAKQSADSLLLELEKIKKQGGAADDRFRQARQLARKSGMQFAQMLNPEIEEEQNENYVLPRPIELGDTVFITDMGEYGEVTALKDKRGRFEVTAGIIKMRVEEKKLRLQNEKRKKNENFSGGKRKKAEREFVPAGSGALEIDIRGMTVDEGISAVDKQIDLCIRNGLDNLYIIHGKGTGALRAGIQNYLKRCKAVKSFRLGAIGEGDAGVTVATIAI